MPVPKSVVKIKKDGVEYISSVERVQYTLRELIRAALNDVGRLLTRRVRPKLSKRTGRLRRYTQYWVRYKQRTPNLQIGFKPNVFYGMFRELGTKDIPKQEVLKSTVLENIDEIRRIQGQYLSAIEDENKALGLIDESEEVGE